MKTIDVTPTWVGVLPLLLTIVGERETVGRESYLSAMKELTRMAELADRYVAEHPKEAEQ